MSLERTAEKAVKKIEKSLSEFDLSSEDKLEILRIIEKSIVNAVEQVSESHREVTVICCGAEADLAHKIQEESERKIRLLISNLKALR